MLLLHLLLLHLLLLLLMMMMMNLSLLQLCGRSLDEARRRTLISCNLG
jgi:hypothetical protein